MATKAEVLKLLKEKPYRWNASIGMLVKIENRQVFVNGLTTKGEWSPAGPWLNKELLRQYDK
jgi:hypothetical protein